jgi:outer membrane murein-binding lipoprotein Lpp
MTGQPSLERKVRRLDNDVQSIYEMLSAIQGTQLRHGNRIDELDQKVDVLDHKVEALDQKVDVLDQKVEALDHKVDARFDQVVELLRSR